MWHLSKGVGKKLAAKAKAKGCEGLFAWMQSVSNHLWWCSAKCNGLSAAKVSFALHCTCCMVNIIIHVYLSLFFKLINNTNNIFFRLCNYIGINCICK